MIVGNANTGMMSVGVVVWNDISTASYASKSYNFSAQITTCVDSSFNDDGTIMYLLRKDGAAGGAWQYTLSTPYDVSTASYASKFKDVFSEDTSPRGMFFKPDGTKMYIIGGSSAKVHQYTLSTPWDVSTASYDSKSADVSSEIASETSIYFNPDGTTMYAGASNGHIYQYTLSTPWDVSTASYASKTKDVTAEDNNETNFYFKPDGTKMFMIGRTASSSIYQYTLSTPWDVSTASYDNDSFNSSAQEAFPEAVTFRDDGTNFYTLGAGGTIIYQYNL